MFAQTVTLHRLSAALANEAVGTAVATCASKGFAATAVIIDVDGIRQAMLRGDGAGIHTLDAANDKAYTAVSFKQDTAQIIEGLQGRPVPQSLAKLPHLFAAPSGFLI